MTSRLNNSEIIDPVKKTINELLEKIQGGSVSAKDIREVRKLFEAGVKKLKIAEGSPDTLEGMLPIQINEGWRIIRFRGELWQHSDLNSQLDISEATLFRGIVRFILQNTSGINQNNITFGDIINQMNQWIIDQRFPTIARIGPVIKKSFPELTQKLIHYSNCELIKRQNNKYLCK